MELCYEVSVYYVTVMAIRPLLHKVGCYRMYQNTEHKHPPSKDSNIAVRAGSTDLRSPRLVLSRLVGSRTASNYQLATNVWGRNT